MPRGAAAKANKKEKKKAEKVKIDEIFGTGGGDGNEDGAHDFGPADIPMPPGMASGDEDNDDCVYNGAYNKGDNASFGFILNGYYLIFRTSRGTLAFRHSKSPNLCEIGVTHSRQSKGRKDQTNHGMPHDSLLCLSLFL